MDSDSKASKKRFFKLMAPYVFGLFCIVLLGIISVSQTEMLADKVEQITKVISEKVQLVREIEMSLLSLRGSVEKYVFSQNEKYNKKAEADIKSVKNALRKAKNHLHAPKDLKIVDDIRILTNEYFDKYRNVVIRFRARNDSRTSIIEMGQKIQKEMFENLTSFKKEGSNEIFSSLYEEFIAARIHVNWYLASYSPLYIEETRKELEGILDTLNKIRIRSLEEIIFSIEDYFDAFETLIALTNKLNQEIEQSVFPIAPKLIVLTKTISSSGWDQMEFARIETARRVGFSRKLVPTLFVITGFMAILVGYFNTRRMLKAEEKNERQEFLNRGFMELSDRLRGEENLRIISQSIISFISNYLSAKIGALYVSDDDESLSLVGTYANHNPDVLDKQFLIGEGLVGQVALEKRPVIIDDCPDGYMKIRSGTGEAISESILISPCLLNNKVKAIIELGAFHRFSDLDQSFMEQVAEGIAIAIDSAQSRNKMSALLMKTQQQAEELESQQEELRQTNEELEGQAKALKKSEEDLQAQQEELQQSNEELEEQSELLEQQKRDINTKNQDLENAKKLLEKKAMDLETASKYKSEFLANMSHELRTPLNSILLLSNLLFENKDGHLSEKQVNFAKTINSSGGELLTLINEILDLSKVEAGKMDLNIESTKIEYITTNIKEIFRPVSDNKGIPLKINIAKGLPDRIYTDQKRVEQVIRNLLTNAFKFTKEGYVSLKVSRPDQGEDLSNSGLIRHETIAFSVEDTGEGIPQEKQKLIFEAFQQADGTTSRKYGGTGLGLSISRELARLLKGEIQLKSIEGEGSTFKLFIPEKMEEDLEVLPDSVDKDSIPDEASQLKDKLVEEEKIEKPAKQQPAQSKPSIIEQDEFIKDDRRDITKGDKVLLIIEDDKEFATTLRDISREREFKVLIAENGETGIHFADYYTPDAIVLDVGLPGIDGWSVLSRLKENMKTRHIPVHFLSASDENFDALKMGAVGFITKPVGMKQLEEVYRRIESIISKKVKNLLIVEDNDVQREAIVELIKDEDLNIIEVSTGKDAFEHLKTGDCDCMILDLGLPDMSGLDLLLKIRDDENIAHIPVIVYTARELTREEETLINKHAEKVVIKGAKSPERLLDETMLFLHRVEADLPEEKRKILKMIHDKESILENKKILLVDDDMRNVFALTSILEEKGMEVLVGKNGLEAIECLNKNPDVDLVLMDIMMPEMDGYEAMSEIRKDKRFKDLPIITLTAKAMKGDRAKCIESGANDYLAKPVDTTKLLSMMRVWLY
ncbi:MAG: response regulator [Thermodesulfobacteriota bacterium]|nr:response regulator [Thermodesulfobacteriota bacterium]